MSTRKKGVQVPLKVKHDSGMQHGDRPPYSCQPGVSPPTLVPHLHSGPSTKHKPRKHAGAGRAAAAAPALAVLCKKLPFPKKQRPSWFVFPVSFLFLFCFFRPLPILLSFLVWRSRWLKLA